MFLNTSENKSDSKTNSDLFQAREQVLADSNTGAVRQRAKEKLTARERIALLLDPGTFHEIGMLRRHDARGFGMEHKRPFTDGAVTGWGLIHGRRVVVAATDFQILGGTLGAAHAEKIQRSMDIALESKIPFITINDGGGARIQEGVRALAGYGGIFRRHVAMSGVVPQVSVILGPCAGGAAYSPALTDFTFMVDDISQMFLTGPSVIKQVTGEDLSANELGGARVHTNRSGVAAFRYSTEEDCLHDVRYLLSILPQNCTEAAERWHTTDPENRTCERLNTLIPNDERIPYDVLNVIEEICDDGEHFEVNAEWAPNIVTSFGHINGRLVGFVANQPSDKAGVLDIDSSHKGARFVQFCDAFGISIVTIVDVPGFLPGSEQEFGGVIRHGAKLLYAYCDASVPRVQIITRKAYGGAYIVMDSQAIGSDVSLAWPSNQIAVMGADGAAEIIFRKKIAASDDPEKQRSSYVEQYRDELMHPFYTVERGLVDEIIAPSETRSALSGILDLLDGKQGKHSPRKHGNQPQ